jgi:hypothetical protein
MIGALIMFFCMSLMIKLLLSKNNSTIIYTGINYLIFLALYFFVVLKRDNLDNLVPLLMIISMSLSIVFYTRKSKRESKVIR